MKTTTLKKGAFNTLINKQSWYYKNSDLNEENFPIETVRTENWKLIKLENYTSSEDCLKLIKDAGCTPANAMELGLFRENHLEEWPDGKWTSIIAFGQTYTDSDGLRRVPSVNRHSDGDWGFGLGYFGGDWVAGHCLLCFCDLQPSETQTTEKNVAPLTLPELTDETAISFLREQGYKITKEY